jgi:deoxyribodipyrimidine photo-lyase
MASSVIDEARIRWRRDGEPQKGDYVLYWMQEAQRSRDNHALEFAVQHANDLGLPLAVVFCVVDDYPDASARHYRFMLEGVADAGKALERRGVVFAALAGDPPSLVAGLARRAALVVTERSYMPTPVRWRAQLEEATQLPVVEVETEVVVPVDLVSDKAETAARTIRPKIKKHLDDFLVELSTTSLDHRDASISLARTAGAPSVDLENIDAAIADLGVDAEPGPVAGWKGGQSQAYAKLERFIEEVLPEYDSRRNAYDEAGTSSDLSPYLHYGHISPVEAARRVMESGAPAEHVESFLDELIVRRELAFNYVLHEPDFDKFSGLPNWAQETLRRHADDPRPEIYSAAQLEAGETEDDIWNTIMKVMRDEGWVHNQLRMYWGKQILRWTNTPEYAHRTLLDLNNRYFLDGRDPNSYANVAWCFGLHDQGFQERDVIGKVRPFTDAALKRKGDLKAWVEANRS